MENYDAIIEVMKEIIARKGKEAAIELVSAAAIPALEQAAKMTANPIDDMVIAALKEPLKQALIDLISKA